MTTTHKFPSLLPLPEGVDQGAACAHTATLLGLGQETGEVLQGLGGAPQQQLLVVAHPAKKCPLKI